MADNIVLTNEDLIDRLLDNLPVGYSNGAVKKPNFPFTTPKNTKWLRPTIIPFETESDAATGEYKITRGLFVVDVFYPKNSGDKNQLEDGNIIKALFENETFGNTQCQTVSVIPSGETGAWYQVQVNINFYMVGF